MILFLNYARSGGTLLNRALANDDEIIIVSEVNRLGSGASSTIPAMVKGGITRQLSLWYDIEMDSKDFIDEISNLKEIQVKFNKTVVVRDWTFIDFYPHFLNGYKPSYKLSSTDVNADVVFALIRNPMDIWLSRDEPLSVFFKNYSRYIRCINDNKVKCFEYELMVSEPLSFFNDLYNYVGINKKLSYEGFFNVKNASGDLQNKNEMNEKKEFVDTSNKVVSEKRKAAFINFIASKPEYFFVVEPYLKNITQRPTYHETYLNYASKNIKLYTKFPIRRILEDLRWRLNFNV
ncbi:MAG: hypothetical protein RPR97_16375 [Colwellia sp.]